MSSTSRTLTAAIIAFFAGVLLVVGSSFVLEPTAGRAGGTEGGTARNLPTGTQVALPTEIAAQRRTAIVEAVQRLAPSVVSVVIEGRRRVSAFGPSMFRDPWFDQFFGPFREQRFTAQAGSAVLINEGGEVLTNHHVVAGADSVWLLLPDGRTVEADLVGTSAELDVALLRSDRLAGMRPAPIGKSTDLVVGEWLVAVGYPVGGRAVTSASRFQPTVTVGVVSATERSFTPDSRARRETQFYADMIQTDAAINPGNSGGPLANALGEVVGINAFILSESGGSQGLGFAIPIERGLRAAEEFRHYGRVRATDLCCLRVQEVGTLELAEALGLETPRGVAITDVSGTAAAAGLRVGDVLIDVDGKPVNSFEEARLALLPRFVGDTIVLGVWRDEERIEIPLELQER